MFVFSFWIEKHLHSSFNVTNSEYYNYTTALLDVLFCSISITGINFKEVPQGYMQRYVILKKPYLLFFYK